MSHQRKDVKGDIGFLILELRKKRSRLKKWICVAEKWYLKATRMGRSQPRGQDELPCGLGWWGRPSVIHVGWVQQNHILDAMLQLLRIFPPLMSHFKDMMQTTDWNWVKVLDKKTTELISVIVKIFFEEKSKLMIISQQHAMIVPNLFFMWQDHSTGWWHEGR